MQGINPIIGFCGPLVILIVFQFLFWRRIGKSWLRLILLYVLSVGTGVLSDVVWKVGNTPSALIAGIVAPLIYCMLFTLVLAFSCTEQDVHVQRVQSKGLSPTIIAAIIQAIATIAAAIISKM